MSFTDLATYKTFAGINNTTFDNQITALLPVVDKIISNYVKRDITSQSYTEYHSGDGQRDVILRQRPVTTLTSVYLDSGGYFGQASGAFASSTLLTSGTDYVLVYDAATQSDRGLVRRIGGFGGISWWPETSDWPKGSLTARAAPYWPVGTGNIKVVYTAGYSSIPADITDAANMLISFIRNNSSIGGPINSETIGRYSYALASRDAALSRDLTDAKTILNSYREVAM